MLCTVKYTVLSLVLKLEGLHCGVKQRFIFHSFFVGSYSSQEDNSQSYNSHTLFKAELSPRKPQTLFSNSCQRFGVRVFFFFFFSRTLREKLLFFIFSVQGAHYDLEKSQ